MQAGVLQAAQHFRHGKAEFLRPEKYLGRGKGVDMQAGPVFAQPAQQIFIPFQRKIRMMAALQQDLRTAQAQGFLNLGGQLLAADQIAVLVARWSEKGAEAAAADADVGIIDVPVSHIGDHRLGMQAQTQPWASAARVCRLAS